MLEPRWITVSEQLSLQLPFGIDVWWLHENMGDLALLSSKERVLLERIKFSQQRRIFLAVRTAVRHIVSNYLKISPEEISLEKTQKGQPILNPRSPLTVSISHSDQQIVLAFSRTHSIGIDIERSNRALEPLALADRFYAPQDAAYLHQSPPESQQTGFLKMWTAKEATVKLLGCGLAHHLKKLITLPNEASYRIQHPTGTCHITHFALPNNYLGALAVAQTPLTIRWLRLRP